MLSQVKSGTKGAMLILVKSGTKPCFLILVLVIILVVILVSHVCNMEFAFQCILCQRYVQTCKQAKQTTFSLLNIQH